jgi:DNA polymerase III subunit chi
MTSVEFHHGISDKLDYACRLLRKAYGRGARVVVTADAATLRQLDRQLWVFEERDFVPHVCALAGQPWAPRLAGTPLWLTDDPASAPGEREVLINLGDEIPPGVERFARFFDVVSSQPDDRQRGRQRWRLYQSYGWAVNAHDASKTPESNP